MTLTSLVIIVTFPVTIVKRALLYTLLFSATIKAKSREPAYSQMLDKNKLDRQRVMQAVKQTAMVGGVCSSEGDGGML